MTQTIQTNEAPMMSAVMIHVHMEPPLTQLMPLIMSSPSASMIVTVDASSVQPALPWK